MTSIEHTTYPRLKRTLTPKELDQIYTPTLKEPGLDTLHIDTQAQSPTIFGMACLLGIALMPRLYQYTLAIGSAQRSTSDRVSVTTVTNMR